MFVVFEGAVAYAWEGELTPFTELTVYVPDSEPSTTQYMGFLKMHGPLDESRKLEASKEDLDYYLRSNK